jgi:flagellar biogenesis protein FliO
MIEIPGQLARRALRLGPVLMALATTPAAAQRLGQGTGTDISIWRVILALLFCLVLGGAAIFVLRRRFRGVRPRAFGRDRRLQLIENIRLSHQVDLCIVSRDGHEYLIAASPQGTTLVDSGPFDAGTPIAKHQPAETSE